MNLVNLFGNKAKTSEPDYFLAIEIHESLIKTALWEVLEGIPSVVNVGSFESWADEDSLINGIDASLEQAVKMIQSEPRKVIFGLPDSWIGDGKIHSSKTKLISRLVKELGLNPIGMVPINSAIAHYMKKLEGIPPTAILLEIYTTKVVVSIIEKGEITASEEAARSDDLAQDVEEGLTIIGKENLPARFILTNGGVLEEEEQRITSHPWQERLPFQHMPKVEVLPVDFSIKAVALTGGTEAVAYLTGEIKDDSPGESLPKEETNIYVPEVTPPSLNDLGFSYEESDPPVSVEKSTSEPNSDQEQYTDEPEFAISQEEPIIIETPKPKRSFSMPHLPKISFPRFNLKGKKLPWPYLLVIPLLLILVFVSYLFTGQAEISIYFNPQKVTGQFVIAIAESSVSGTPTLLATRKTISGTAQDQVPTTGDATVGDKASGTVTIVNKSASPLIIKAGAPIISENGKYTYTLQAETTVASASSDFNGTTFGKITGVPVTASKIGADYNLSKDTTFSVNNYTKSVSAAVADTDFTGGTSRAVRAVSKADQDKLLQAATEKIKAQIQSSTNSQTPGTQTLSLADFVYTKKNFDKNIGEEATALSIDLEGSVETLVYSEDSLYLLISGELSPQIPAGSEIFQGNTQIKIEAPVKKTDHYEAKVNVETSIFPKIDEEKLRNIIKGKSVTGIRPFFSTINGFDHLTVRITPKIPIVTKILPLKNIGFSLVEN